MKLKEKEEMNSMGIFNEEREKKIRFNYHLK